MSDPDSASQPIASSLPADTTSNADLSYPQHKQKPPVFGSSCWGYGLWFAGASSLRQLSEVRHLLDSGDREGAITTVCIPLVLLALASAFDISRARRAGKLRPWHWLNLIPAAFVLLFAVFAVSQENRLHPAQVSNWVTVSPAGTGCSVLMPGQPTDRPIPDSTRQSGVDAHMCMYSDETEAYILTCLRYPKDSLQTDGVALMEQQLLHQFGGEARDTRDMHLDTTPARQFTVDDPEHRVTYVYRICRVGDTIYALAYTSPMNRTNTQNAEGYFNSFHLAGEGASVH